MKLLQKYTTISEEYNILLRLLQPRGLWKWLSKKYLVRNQVASPSGTSVQGSAKY